ncbi:MAG: four helix bundle protein [Gemmataceae bacterium]|nr:four helix bundle protein [Gemmataceae bacterium]
MDLVDAVYTATEGFPTTERYGVTSQVQRAAVSVPCNIAEGYGRSHRGDYLRFLSIARGSLCEVETLLLISARRKYVTKEQVDPLLALTKRIGQMLARLMQSLNPPREPEPSAAAPKPR